MDEHGYYSMDEHWKHYAKWKRIDVEGRILWFHWYEVPRVAKFVETEDRMVVARVCGREEWNVIVKWVHSFHLGRWKNAGDKWWWWLWIADTWCHWTVCLQWSTWCYVCFATLKRNVLKLRQTFLRGWVAGPKSPMFGYHLVKKHNLYLHSFNL